MGHALDSVLDLTNDLHGSIAWGPHPKAPAFIEIELALPDLTEPCDGAGTTVDDAAMNLLLVHFPDRVQVDPHLYALVAEQTEAA